MLLSDDRMAIRHSLGQLLYRSDRDAMLFHSPVRNEAFLLTRSTLEGMSRQLEQIATMYDQRRDQLSPQERESIEEQFRHPGFDLGSALGSVDRVEESISWQGAPARKYTFRMEDQPGSEPLGHAVILDQPPVSLSSDQQSVLNGLTGYLEVLHRMATSVASIQGREMPSIPGLGEDFSNLMQLAEFQVKGYSMRLVDHGETDESLSLPEGIETTTLDDLIQGMIQPDSAGGDPGGLPRPENGD
jgi:hypothetical protein